MIKTDVQIKGARNLPEPPAPTKEGATALLPERNV
jgi:hypothetical protein